MTTRIAHPDLNRNLVLIGGRGCGKSSVAKRLVRLNRNFMLFSLDALIRYEVARTRALFERARPLVERVGADFAIEVAIMWHGGMRILDKIDSFGGRVLERRPQLTNADKAVVVLKVGTA